jgi:hypothetical protein
MLQLEHGDDLVTRAQIDAAGLLSEYTDLAVWVTWGADVIVMAVWVWLIVLVVGSA